MTVTAICWVGKIKISRRHAQGMAPAAPRATYEAGALNMKANLVLLPAVSQYVG